MGFTGANCGSQRAQIPLDPPRPLRHVTAGGQLLVRLPQIGASHRIRAWGSRGRRFKSGRPDWSKYVFEHSNWPLRWPWERSALPRRLRGIARRLCKRPADQDLLRTRARAWRGDFSSWRGRTFLQVKGSPVQIGAVKAGPEQQQPLTGGADQRLPLCPAWVLAAHCRAHGLWMLIATVDGAARRPGTRRARIPATFCAARSSCSSSGRRCRPRRHARAGRHIRR